jgi:hypothetical protein
MSRPAAQTCTYVISKHMPSGLLEAYQQNITSPMLTPHWQIFIRHNDMSAPI